MKRKQVLTCKELEKYLIEGKRIPLPRITLKRKIKDWLIRKIQNL